MARRIHITLVDDIDETEGARTVPFSLDGKSYTIDLSPTNEAKLQAALAPFIDKASKARARGKRVGGPSKALANPAENALIREWARAQGHDVSDRGRVPTHLIEAYRAVH